MVGSWSSLFNSIVDKRKQTRTLIVVLVKEWLRQNQTQSCITILMKVKP